MTTLWQVYQQLAPAFFLSALVALALGRALRPMGAVAAGVAVVLLPLFGGLSLVRVVLGVSPSYSVVSVALALSFFIRVSRGRVMLDDRAILVLCCVESLAGAVVFVSALGFAEFDLYALGYGFGAAHVAVAAVTVGVALLSPAAGAALMFAALYRWLYPSMNIFDALVDGPAFIASLILLGARLVRRVRGAGPGRV